MPLIDILNDYRLSVSEANSHISLAFQRNRSRSYKLQKSQRDFITDSAFLKIFISWETFLEKSFISYILGETSINGNTIIRYVKPLDANHANKLLIGTQKYVDWSNPDIVKKLSNLYFSAGNPIDTFLSSNMSDLFDLKTIRNAAAHLSSTTKPQLDSLATRKLGRQITNISVSDFIFSLDPNSATGDTILTTYLKYLDVTAEGIAKG